MHISLFLYSDVGVYSWDPYLFNNGWHYYLLAENACWIVGWQIKSSVKRLWHFYFKIWNSVFIKMGFLHQLGWDNYTRNNWLNIIKYDHLSLLHWTQTLLRLCRRLCYLQINKYLCLCQERYWHMFEFYSLSMMCNDNKYGGKCSIRILNVPALLCEHFL